MTETMKQIISENYPTNPLFPTRTWLRILQAYGTMKPKQYYGYVLESLEYATKYGYEELEYWYWEFMNDRDEDEPIEAMLDSFVTIALEHDL